MTDERTSASYLFAARKGLISSPDWRIRYEEHAKTACPYGLTGKLSIEAFILRDLSRLKLRYMMESGTECEEANAFYDRNRDLFTRYEGDSFRFDEVKDVINKMIREAEWEEGVDEILCKLS